MPGLPVVTTPAGEAAATPRRRARWAVVVALVLVALLAGVIGSSLVAVRSANGTAWLLARLPSLSASGVRGNLVGGPFAADRLELQAGGRRIVVTGLAWSDLHWRWRPHPGAWYGLTLTQPRAARVEIGAGDASAPPLALPTSLRAPLALTLLEPRIEVLQIEALPALSAVHAERVQLGGDAGATHEVRGLVFEWQRFRGEASARIAADAPFALQAQSRLQSLAGAAPAWQAQAQLQGPLAQIGLSARLASAQAGGPQLDAQAELRPFAAWPLAALKASTSALDLAALWGSAPATRIDGQASLRSSALDAPIDVDITLRNALPGRWDQQRLPLAALDLALRARASDRRTLNVERFTAQLAGDGGRIEGSGRWQADAATLSLRLQGLRPNAIDARLGAMTLAGTLAVSANGLPAPDGSTAGAATLTAQVQGQLDGRLDKLGPPVRLQLDAQAERMTQGPVRERVELRRFEASSGAARAQAMLHWQRDEGGAWQARSTGQMTGFDPQPWWPVLAAQRATTYRLDGRWNAALANAAPRDSAATLTGEATLDLQPTSLVAGVPTQGRVGLRNSGAGWDTTADLRAAGNHLLLEGLLAPRAADDRWRADVDAPALAALAPIARLHPALQAALPASGSLAANATLQGRWPSVRSEGDMRATDLQWGAWRAAKLEARWQAGSDAQAPLALQLDAKALTSGVHRADSLQLRLDGSLAAHRLALDVSSPLQPPAWADALTAAPGSGGSTWRLRAEGQWSGDRGSPGAALAGSQWQGRVLEVQAQPRSTTAAAPWLVARNLPLRLRFDAEGRPLEAQAEPGRIELLGAALRWSEARWQAPTPTRAYDTIAVEAELEPLLVAPWLSRSQPDVRWGGDLTLGGRLSLQRGERFAADLVLERARGDLSVTDETGTLALGLTDLRLGLVAKDGTWHFTQAVAGPNLGVLAGAQSLRMTPQSVWPTPDTPMEGVLEWRVADLGVWAPFTPPGWRVGGTLRTSATIGGRFGAPEITGEMVGSQLALRNLLQGVDVRDGELALSLRGAQARIERFVFRGGDGRLELSGGATLGAAPSAQLKLVAERFALLGRFDRRIVASGQADLALQPQRLQLSGNFRVDEGLIDFSRTDAPSLDDDVRVIGHAVKGDTSATAGAQANGADTRALPLALRQASVALQVDLGERLVVRGRGLDTQLRGRLALTAPGGRPTLSGSVRTEAGTYAAYGQKLTIERGVLAFVGTPDNPRLDIVALRPNLDLRVGVAVTGTAQNPRVRLFSEPEMSDTDKLSWLVLGRAPDGLARADTALLQRAALALLAGEGESPDAALLRNIGLDEFSVRQTDSGDVRDTVVTLGKQLSRRWYVGYERGVNATTGTWQLIYRVAQRFTLRAQSGSDNSLDAIWTWRWN